MTCLNCLRLEDRIKELEKRMGLARAQSSVGAVSWHLDVCGTEARLLLRLYAGRGEPLAAEALMYDFASSRIAFNTRVYQLRAKLPGVIESRRAHGLAHGYWLTPKGLSMVLAALENPEFQDARG